MSETQDQKTPEPKVTEPARPVVSLGRLQICGRAELSHVRATLGRLEIGGGFVPGLTPTTATTTASEAEVPHE